jgi:hypothetical protein
VLHSILQASGRLESRMRRRQEVPEYETHMGSWLLILTAAETMTATKFNALLDMSCRHATRQDPFTWGSFWMLVSTAATFDRLKTRHLDQYVLPTRS